MEWTDVRNTSSTSIFDYKGRFRSVPSGGLAVPSVIGNIHAPHLCGGLLILVEFHHSHFPLFSFKDPFAKNLFLYFVSLAFQV